jgi:hypothetical protein
MEEENTDTNYVYFTVITQCSVTYKVCLDITFKDTTLTHVACYFLEPCNKTECFFIDFRSHPQKEAAACCHTFSVSCTQDSISKRDDGVIL